MPKHLHLDMPSGAAGDMLLAALCDLGFSLDSLERALVAMGLGASGLKLESVRVGSLRAQRFSVSGHREHEPHRSYRDIRELLAQADLPAAALRRAEAMFRRLAEAEAEAHGVDIEQVHFHEVGAVDSIADITGLALALEELGVDSISASVPLLGQGLIQSQHGPLPVPAPATLHCLRGLPVRRTALDAELTTPTAACFLATQVDGFGPPPEMRLDKVGLGAGCRTLPDRPNLLRAWLGESARAQAEREWQLEVNIDDMPGEQLAFLMERLFAGGALDVWFAPVTMKKSRPAVVLGLLCAETKREAIEDILLAESSSLGLRRWVVERRKLSRRIVRVQTEHGPLRIKLGGLEGPGQIVAPEFEDCRRLALERDLPIKTLYEAARQAWRDGKVLPTEGINEGS